MKKCLHCGRLVAYANRFGDCPYCSVDSLVPYEPEQPPVMGRVTASDLPALMNDDPADIAGEGFGMHGLRETLLSADPGPAEPEAARGGVEEAVRAFQRAGAARPAVRHLLETGGASHLERHGVFKVRRHGPAFYVDPGRGKYRCGTGGHWVSILTDQQWMNPLSDAFAGELCEWDEGEQPFTTAELIERYARDGVVRVWVDGGVFRVRKTYHGVDWATELPGSPALFWDPCCCGRANPWHEDFDAEILPWPDD